jgi:hypothetical protein
LEVEDCGIVSTTPRRRKPVHVPDNRKVRASITRKTFTAFLRLRVCLIAVTTA